MKLAAICALSLLVASASAGRCCLESSCYSNVTEAVCTGYSGTYDAQVGCGGCTLPPASLNGTGGGDVSFSAELDLSNLGNTLAEGDSIAFAAISDATVANFPALAGGSEILLAFEINHLDDLGNEVSDYTAAGEYISVDITADPDFTQNEPITIYRLDGAAWVKSSDDCNHNPPALDAAEIANEWIPATSAWRVKICHTSSYAAANGDDGDDKKDKKKKANSKHVKVASKGKAGKADAPKDGGKGGKDGKKKAAAIGGAVAGAVVVVGALGGVVMYRRRKQQKQPKEEKTQPTTISI